jgi:hypothetical protein
VCDFEIEFRAIGDRSVEEACRGWEVVAVMIDEADLQPPDLLAFLSGRVGRSSDLDPALVVDQQIILSLNAPYMDNWIYGLAIEKNLGELSDPELIEALGDRQLLEVFIQPGGREPDAENLHNLPKGYYAIQAAANKHRPDYVARMIDNKFVPMQHGQPVNPQFDYRQHVRPLEWDRRRPLIVGVDQGLFAAAVASQRTVMGGLRTLREAVMFREDGKTLAKIGPTAAGAMVRTMIADNFPELHPDDLRVVADPAAWAAADRADHEMDWVRAFSKGLGHKVRKAKSNKQTLRNEAIWRAMGERDGYAVDPACKHLIRGHLGGYHYRQRRDRRWRRRDARPPRDRRHDPHPRLRRRAIRGARGRTRDRRHSREAARNGRCPRQRQRFRCLCRSLSDELFDQIADFQRPRPGEPYPRPGPQEETDPAGRSGDARRCQDARRPAGRTAPAQGRGRRHADRHARRGGHGRERRPADRQQLKPPQGRNE